jgi:hypothetical protein
MAISHQNFHQKIGLMAKGQKRASNSLYWNKMLYGRGQF